MALTAVVVTYQSASIVGACLESLAGTPTIVVDNASDDAIGEVVAAHPHARLVRRARNDGFAAAVNDGIDACAGDVLLVNPDARVVADAVDRLAEALDDDPGVGIVAPRLVHPDGSVQDSARTFKSVATVLARRTPLGAKGPLRRERDRHLAASSSSGPRDVEWVLGAAMLVRRVAIDEVGPMDSGFFLYEEDQDWCIRMWQHGWRVRLEPSATFIHDYQRASRGSFRFDRRATRAHWRSLARLARKYPRMFLLGRRPDER